MATIKLAKGARSKTLLMFGQILNRDASVEVEAIDALRVFAKTRAKKAPAKPKKSALEE